MQNDKGGHRCNCKLRKPRVELLTLSLWEDLAMCGSVPTRARGACTEGKRVRTHRGFQRRWLGDTFFLLGFFTAVSLLGSCQPFIHLPRGGGMTYPIAAFRNRDSVTQSFPGGDPSVPLLCAVNFTEAGLCREGAACG